MYNRWAGKHECCVNCHTANRRHVARGFCTKCYRLKRRIEVMVQWRIIEDDSHVEESGVPLEAFPRRFWVVDERGHGRYGKTYDACQRYIDALRHQYEYHFDRFGMHGRTMRRDSEDDRDLDLSLEYEMGWLANKLGLDGDRLF